MWYYAQGVLVDEYCLRQHVPLLKMFGQMSGLDEKTYLRGLANNKGADQSARIV